MNLLSAVLVFTTLFRIILAAATSGDIMARQEGELSLKRQQFGEPASSCALEVLCCNAVESAGNPAVQQILGLLGASATPDMQVGLGCSPITVIGVGGASCSAEPVCCWWGAEYAWIVAIDCYPIDLEA